jgi:lipid-A-disaccharide synthase
MSGVDIFLLAGEPSGDLQGAALIQELLILDPTLRIAAVAGPRMRELPIECVEPMESLSVMGFIDVVKALPKIARIFFSLRKKILERSPKAFVGIDYPGFNLQMHKSLKKNGFTGKQIHYICPTVWAWGKGRILKMEKSLDLLLTLLPFEPDCFKGTSLKAEYVGHPLIEPIVNFRPDPTFRKRFGFKEMDKILALFPGSRKAEVETNLPLMLKAAEKIKDPNLRLAISQDFPAEENYNLMHNAHLALAKSGTVVLELALHKTPTVVQYAIKPLDVFLATKIFRINLPYYSIANLILQKEIFPELFGPRLSEAALIAHAKELWFEEEKRKTAISGCSELWDALGNRPASRIAALKIQSLTSNFQDRL